MSETSSKTRATDIDLVLTAVDQIQETLEEHTTALHHLEQRPILDLTTIEHQLKETVDAVDRLTNERMPKLIARRWWLCWLWLGTGLLMGMLCTYWLFQTPKGKQVLGIVWPAGIVQPVQPPVRKK